MNFGRIIAFVEAPILVAAAFITILHPWRLSDVVVIFSGALAIVLLLVHIFVRHRSPSRLRSNKFGRAEPEDIDIADLIRAEKFIDNNYPFASVDYFRRILSDRPSYLSRVDERMELDGSIATVYTTLFFRRASTSASIQAEEEMRADTDSKFDIKRRKKGPNSALFPLVSVRKGLLFDNFEAYDQSGATLPTLSQWEVRGLLVVALRSLFAQALAVKVDPKEKIPVIGSQERHILLQVALAVVRTVPGQNKQEQEWGANVSDALSMIDGLDSERFDEEWKNRIKRFCTSLAGEYWIVVEVPNPQTVNMVLSYRNVVTANQVSFKLEQRLRTKHGLAPVVIDAPMTWAFLPDSYHFELHAPPGQYVFDHHLERLETATKLKREDFFLGDVQQYVRLHEEKGHYIAHLYIRRVHYNRHPQIAARSTEAHGEEADGSTTNSNNLDALDFKSVIRFKEVPPGTLGNAVTIAFFTAVIISYYAFIHGVQPNGSTGINQGILSLLLAFPAFIAVALGRGITSDNIRATSLATFYGLWVVVLTSVTAVLAFISNLDRFHSLRFSWQIFGLTKTLNIVWVLLALLSVTVYLVLRKEKSDHRRNYLQMLKETTAMSRGK